MKRIKEITADGSVTLFVPELNEHYHSVKGALTESMHVFIRTGLQHHTADPISILEVGFGTGLNAWLTCREAAETGRTVYYTALERYPLDMDEVHGLLEPADQRFFNLHLAPWEEETRLTPTFRLLKKKVDFTVMTDPLDGVQGFDLIYFDAFAPEKQPEMWTRERLSYLYDRLNIGGVLTTYCAKGHIRRTLQDVGFTTERLPGPPQGKREILRATKLN